MALRCLQFYSSNPWESHDTFHESGHGPEGGGEAATDVYEGYKKEVLSQLKDTEQKQTLEKIVDNAKKGKVKIETLTTVLEPLVDALKAAESFPPDRRAEMTAKLDKITTDGTISGAEVRELVDLRFVEERNQFSASIEKTATKDAYVYLNVDKSRLDKAFKVNDSYTINFGIGEEGVDQEKALAIQKITRLDHMLPATVNQVEVKSLHFGETVVLTRYSDGKFRLAGKSLKDRHYYVFQGDEITILSRTDTSAEKVEAATTTIKEEEKKVDTAKADAAAAQAKEMEARRQELIGQNYDYYAEGLRMNSDTAVRLPEEFLHKSGQALQEALPRMQYGEQLKDALTTLSAIQSQAINKKSSPIGLLENIRTRQLASRNTVSFTEVTREVLDKTPDEVNTELKKLVQTNPAEGTPEYVRLELIRSFYSAVAKLMNALRKMNTVALSSEGSLAPEEVQKVIDPAHSLQALDETVSLFFDSNKGSAEADPKFWQGVRGQDKHEITMDYSENKVYGEKATEFKNYDEAAAWERVRSSALVYKDGVAIYDPKTLISNLNFYLNLGKARSSMTKDYEAIRALPPLLESDLSTLKDNPKLDLYKKAIQLGFAESLEGRAASAAESTESPMGISESVALAAQLTPEELREAQTRLKEYQVLTLGALINSATSEKMTELGADIRVPLTEDGRLTVHAGLRENVYHQELELHVGPTYEIIRSDRVSLSASAGVGVNPGTGEAKLGGGLDMNVGLGKEGVEHIWNLNVGLGGGLNTRNMGLALGAYLGVSRDLQAVLAKKTETTLEAHGQNMDQALKEYQQCLIEYRFSPEYQKIYLDRMARSLKDAAAAQAIDDMQDVQFGGAGVSVVYVPGINAVVPIPYVNILLKENPYAVYETAGMDLDAQAQEQLNSAAKRQLGTRTIQVYESGTLLEGPDGNRRITEAEVDIDLEDKRLTKLNAALSSQGLRLEMEPDGKLRLDISNVRGNADIYTDPSSGLETYTEGGKIYLNVGTTDHLAIKRIDEWSMAKRDNAYQNVKIYISNNLQADPKTIRETTDKHLHFERMEKGVYSSAVEIRDQGAYTKMTERGDQGQAVATGRAEATTTRLSEKSTFGSEQALKEAGLQTMLMPEDYEARATALKEIRGLIRAKNTAEISTADNQKIDLAVARIMSDDAIRLEYKDLSVNYSAQDLISFLNKNAPELDTKNERVLTVTLQRLMEASLSTNDFSDPKKLEAMIAWNEKRVTQKLQIDYGLDEVTARDISQQWMETWSNPANLTPTPIPNGASVDIEVGTEGIQGTRSSTWTEGGNLLGAINLNAVPALKAKLAEQLLNQMDQAPFTMQLGIALLDKSDLFFTSKELQSIKAMMEGGARDETTFNKFTTILKSLYLKGSWTSPDGSTTITSTSVDLVGLYDGCLNFTEVYQSKLKVTVKVPEDAAAGARTIEFLRPRANVEFVGIGAAVGVRVPGEEVAAQETGSGDELDSADEGDPVAPGNESDDDHFGS